VTAGLRNPPIHRLPEPRRPWGRWFRQIEVTEQGGQTVMTGANAAPLLMLDRVGEGRVALLASDHAWLWDRGYEGGGPQLEMLRRLAHWMMGEPDLEEEALRAIGGRADPDRHAPDAGDRSARSGSPSRWQEETARR
jgi:hypothetical protein